MANHKSAVKRARQNLVRRARNKSVKTRIKGAVKKVRLAAKEGLQEDAEKNLDTAKSLIHKAAQKGVIHRKNAARKISRMSNLINTLSV